MDVKPTPLSYLSSQSGNGSRPTALMFAVSALGHMLFLLLLILAPSQIPAQRYRPSVIQVSMVSVPSPGTGPGPAPAPMVTAEAEVSAPVTAAPRKTAPQPAGIPVVRPEPVKPPADEAVVSTATRSEPETAPDIISVAPKKEKVKTKVSLKKKTLRSAQVIQRAIKQIEEKSEAPRPKRVADAIDKPQDEVGTGAEKTTGPSSPVEQAIAQLRDRVEAGVGRPGGHWYTW